MSQQLTRYKQPSAVRLKPGSSHIAVGLANHYTAATSIDWILLPTYLLFRKCCSHCRFQPRDCVIIRFTEYSQCQYSVHLQILLMGTCRQCGSWSVAGHSTSALGVLNDYALYKSMHSLTRGDWARPHLWSKQTCLSTSVWSTCRYSTWCSAAAISFYWWVSLPSIQASCTMTSSLSLPTCLAQLGTPVKNATQSESHYTIA